MSATVKYYMSIFSSTQLNTLRGGTITIPRLYIKIFYIKSLINWRNVTQQDLGINSHS